MKRPDIGLQDDELISAEKAYEIVKLLFSKRNDQSKIRTDRIIKEIGNVLNKPYYSDEIKIHMDSTNLSQRLTQMEYEKLLANRIVVGVGGQFSAGKSCFLNSIIGNDVLPEEISPTTSIATYIVRGKGDAPACFAYTHRGDRLHLTLDHVQCLTHQMTKQYLINISGAVLSLGLELPSFAFNNTALLDTPGYSKPDGNHMDASDRLKAFDMLSKVDFLIWLIDSDNGELTQDDIQFIQSLNIRRNILFLATKADKKTEINNVISKIRATINQKRLPVYDVVPYSSVDPERFLEGKNVVWAYLNMCDSEGRKVKGFAEQISANTAKLIESLNTHQTSASDLKDEIREAIMDNVVPGNKALPYYFFETLHKMQDAQADKNSVIRSKRIFDNNLRGAHNG